MKFGKMLSVKDVCFDLPSVPSFTQNNFSTIERKERANIYLGCTGWGMKEWVGKAYPKGTKQNEYLTYYGKQFNTIELNTTHYRIPSLSTIDKWKQTVPDTFRFCPKVLQSISHSKDFGMSKELIPQFKKHIVHLEEYLGPCFVQMPPYFGIDRYEQLSYFLNQWGTDIPLAVEVRHPSWFENEEATESLFQLLKSHNKGVVITDVAGRRDVLHLGITTNYAMIRWVGNGLVDSDFERLDAWTDLIQQWVEQGIHDIYFFLHEPDNILAPEITLYLAKNLENILNNTNIIIPKIPYEDEVSQLTLF